jgi:hypothetical protein
MFRQMFGDRSVRDDFFWYHVPWSDSTDDSLKRAYIVWHENVTNLKKSAEICQFCSVVQEDLDKSYHYATHVKESEKRTVWLEVPVQSSGSDPLRGGNPHLSIWIGETRPEVIVSGVWKFTTTPGTYTSRIIIRA